MLTPMSTDPSSAVPNPDPGGSANGAAEPDWTDQVADLIVDTVDKIRSRTTGPIQNVVRASVYGLVALIVVIPILIAFFAGLVRFLNYIIPGDVWIAYLTIAVGMWLIGWFVWSRRKPTD